MTSTPPDMGEGSGWVCIYPVYIDASRSLKGGRRVAKEHCCLRPTARQIAEVANALHLPVFIDGRKRHPHDCFTYGRCHIRLQRDGRDVHPKIKTRKDLMRELGVKIPRLKSRITMEANVAKMASLQIKQQEAQAAKAQSRSTAGSSKKSKKKRNKKKK